MLFTGINCCIFWSLDSLVSLVTCCGLNDYEIRMHFLWSHLHQLRTQSCLWYNRYWLCFCNIISSNIHPKIGVMRRWRRRCKHLLYDFKKTSRDWKLREGALYHTAWSTGFGREYGVVIRQTVIVWESPSSAIVKNALRYVFTPYIIFMVLCFIKQRDNVTCLLRIWCSYRISRPTRRTFFPEKYDLNLTCLLCAECKYYFQTYKYPYI